MKKLKALALSDLHLGEPETLLYDNQYDIIDTTILKIEELSHAAENSRFESGIEELILIGDIVDLSEAPDKEAYQNTRNLLTHLLCKVNVEKVVYIPGNHDHHLWVKVLCKDYYKTQNNCKPEIPELPLCVEDPSAFIDNCLPSQHPPVEVWYPYYALDIKNQYFLFDHGHLFSKTLKKLSRPCTINRILRLFGKAREARTLKELEEMTYCFMEWVWHPKETRLLDVREKIYDWLRRASLRVKHKSTRRTTFEQDSRPIYDDDLLDQIKWYLLDICKIEGPAFSKKDFHLVFGHTHIGGTVLKADRKFRMKGPFISVWNTGGWLVPSRVFSPDAYILYIERTRDGLDPNPYKMVKSYGDPPIGDYDKRLLHTRLRGI